jgi:uncharacterized membrane protein
MTTDTIDRTQRTDPATMPVAPPAQVADGGAHRSTAAIAGHPIHPAIVPIPIGMIVATALSDLAHLLTRDGFFARASRFLVAGSIVSALVAAIPGILDFSTIRAARGRTGFAHAGGNLTIVGLSALSLILRNGSRRRVPAAAMALSALAAALVGVTGWLGGELTFRERIGVVPLDDR